MKVTITQKINTEFYLGLMEVSRISDRDDLLPILKAVDECPYTIDLETYIQEKIYSALPISFSKNVIVELKLMGLIGENNEITEIGIQSLEDGKTMISEKGMYEIRIADLSPVCWQRVLSLTPFTKKENGKNEDVILPVEDFQLRKVLPRFGTNYSINSCDPKGQRLAEKSKEIVSTLIFDSKNANWSFTVHDRRESITLDLSDEFNYDLWRTILESNPYGMELDGEKWKTRFESTNRNERMNFMASRKYTLQSIEGLIDTPVEVHIEDIELLPSLRKDAQEWLDWLVSEEINSYILPSELEYLYGKISEKEIFNDFSLTFKESEELASNSMKNERKYWHLIAPLDFKLEEDF